MKDGAAIKTSNYGWDIVEDSIIVILVLIEVIFHFR